MLEAAICTIEQIEGKLEELQGEDRDWMGSTRMEEYKLKAELLHPNPKKNFGPLKVAKNNLFLENAFASFKRHM